MATTTGLAGFLSRVGGERADDTRSDGDVLRDYVALRSDAAFTELVRRFAPMVWGVCRRTVGHQQHAEDAFQAVFVVLVRKPDAIHPPAAVGGWLHAVALRTSLRARAMAERRRQWECSGADVPDRAAPDGPESLDPDLVRMLDEEIARLPDKLRAAVALCELGGLNRRDAAQRLGVAEGTLSSRLAAARQQLATRLRARGATLGAGGIAVGFGAGPAVAAPRISSTVSEHVSELADGVIRTMFLSKLRLMTAGVAVGLALLGGVLAASGGETGDPPRPAAVPVARIGAPTPKGALREGTILLWVDEKPQLLKPDGTERESPDPIPKANLGVGSGHAQLSPDGSKVAFMMLGAEYKPKVPPAGAGAPVPFLIHRTTLKVLDLGGKKETKTLDTVNVNGFFWLADGKTLYVRGNEIGANEEASADLGDWVYDPTTDKRVSLNVPKDFVVRAIGPDGKTAVADEWKMDANTWHQRAHLWTVGTDKPTPLLELNHGLNSPKFSPDGKRLLCNVSHYGSYTPQGGGAFTLGDFKFNNVVVIDLATKKQTIVKELGEDPEWLVGGLAWSPDGKKIAFTEVKRLPRQDGVPMAQDPFRVTVADPDGKNAKEVYKTTGGWLVGFDWK